MKLTADSATGTSARPGITFGCSLMVGPARESVVAGVRSPTSYVNRRLKGQTSSGLGAPSPLPSPSAPRLQYGHDPRRAEPPAGPTPPGPARPRARPAARLAGRARPAA